MVTPSCSSRRVGLCVIKSLQSSSSGQVWNNNSKHQNTRSWTLPVIDKFLWRKIDDDASAGSESMGEQHNSFQHHCYPHHRNMEIDLKNGLQKKIRNSSNCVHAHFVINLIRVWSPKKKFKQQSLFSCYHLFCPGFLKLYTHQSKACVCVCVQKILPTQRNKKRPVFNSTRADSFTKAIKTGNSFKCL